MAQVAARTANLLRLRTIYLEYGADRDYYLASAASKVFLMPSSTLDLTGVVTHQLFLRGTLEKIGAQPDLHHVGNYKTAVNTFTEKSYTAAHREMDLSLNRDLYEQIVKGIAETRGKSEADVRTLIDEGPFLSENALRAGLIDDVAYEDEVVRKLREAMAAKGLGTPATRAAIIEGLIREDYVHREGKELVPTPKAFSLMFALHMLHIVELGSPELTGEWEHKLKLIEAGKLTREEFMAQINDLVKSIVHTIKHGEIPDVVYATVPAPCPKCGGPGRRETDTMPNWAGSDWYFLRYCDPHNDHALADMDKLRYWMPVDVYIGGDEHNTLHLLYSRFIYLFLHDLGVVPPEYPEPYRKRLSHGVILGPDGQRMSKSRGNVILPQEYVERYGADALRLYLLFMGPYDATMAWNERALLGVKRFLDRYSRFVRDHAGHSPESGPRVKAAVNRLGKAVAEDIASFKYNTAIAHMMETLNTLHDLVESNDQHERIADQQLRTFSQVLAPYAPFTAENCWQMAGGKNSIHKASWPVYDPRLELEELVTIAIQVNGKLRGTVAVPHQTTESEIRHLAELQPGIAKFLLDREVTKVIYVPMRTMNFVVK